MRKIENFFKSMLEAIGVIGSFITISWAIFQDTLGEIEIICPWLLVFIFFIISFIYALSTNWPKTKIKLKLSEKVTAEVFFGDLFTSKEIIVIPVNEYFDTIVDEKIISSKTLHGIFVINYFGGNEADLKKQISNELNDVDHIDVNSGRSAGNKKKYPLGTVCQVKKDDKIFFLVALTKFNENDRAEVKNSEYQRVLCDLFSYVEQNSQGRKLNIPLIGAGHSGVNLSKQKILEFLLFSIGLKDNLTLIGGVNIVLHNSIKSEIDLNSAEILFNSIGS